MKELLIPEEKFQKDFSFLAGFYDYHVKGKKLAISLSEIQQYGVDLYPKKLNDIANLKYDDIPSNSIIFSSSKKSKNVKNLMWAIRCLVSHPENIEIIERDEKNYYKIICFMKRNSIVLPNMKGIISCDIWEKFVRKLCERIKEEKHEK